MSAATLTTEESAMDHPLLIISNAISDGDRQINPDRAARNAARALTDERIVANAVAALAEDGIYPGITLGTITATTEDVANIARTVLRSVGGA
jgi:hypothetical protein